MPDINKLGDNGGTGCGDGCQNHPSWGLPLSGGINTAAKAIELQNSECGSANCHHSEVGSNSELDSVNANQEYKNTNIPTTDYLSSTHQSGCSSGACYENGANIISGAQVATEANEKTNNDSTSDSSFGIKSGTSFLKKDDHTLSFGCKDSKCNTFGTNYKPQFIDSEEQPTNYDSPQKCSLSSCTSNTEKEAINSPLLNSNDIPAKSYQPEGVKHSEHNLQEKNWATSHEISSTDATNGNKAYKQPVTFLETPKETTCFTSNCQQQLHKEAARPSSYDVPIHAGVNTFQVDSQSSPHKNPNLASYNVPSSVLGTSNCKTSNCVGQSFIHPGSTQFGIPSAQPFDSKYSSTGLPSSNTAATGSSGLYRPNGFHVAVSSDKPLVIQQDEFYTSTKPSAQYSTQRIPSNGLSGVPNFIPHDFNLNTGSVVTQTPIFTKPDEVIKPSSQKTTVYTGGFGGPPGILKPNEFNFYPNLPTPQITTTLKPNIKPSDQRLPTHTNEFHGPSGLLKPDKVNDAKPSVNANSEANAQTQLSDFAKPVSFGKPLNQNIPPYTHVLSQPTETSHPSSNTIPEPFPQTGHTSFLQPVTSVKPLNENLPTYMGGFGGPSGLLKPNEVDVLNPSVNVNTGTAVHAGSPHVVEPNAFDKPLNQNYPTYTGGLSVPTGAPNTNEFSFPHHFDSSTGILSHKEYPSSKPSTDVKPTNQKPTTHTGEFPESPKPNAFIAAQPAVTANAAAVAHSDYSAMTKPPTVDYKSPKNKKLPTQTFEISKPSGLFTLDHIATNPSDNEKDSHTNNSPISNPLDKKLQTLTGVEPNESYANQPSVSTNADAIFQTGHEVFPKPSADIKTTENKPIYTNGFGGPSGSLKRNEFDIFGNINSSAGAHTEVINPNAFDKPSNPNQPTYTSTLDRSLKSHKPNGIVSDHTVDNTNAAAMVHVLEKLPSNLDGFGKPLEMLKPSQVDTTHPSIAVVSNTQHFPIAHPIAVNKPSNQNIPNSMSSFGEPFGLDKSKKYNSGQPLATVTVSTDAISNTGYPVVTKPSPGVKPSYEILTVNTDGISGSSESQKSNEFGIASSSVNSNTDAVPQAVHTAFGHPSVKPMNLLTHTNSFGGPSQLEKCNDLNAGTPTKVNTTPFVQTQQAVSTSSLAKPEAVAYSGGFGGPPGLLQPYDNGKLISNVPSGKPLLDSQLGDKHRPIHSDIGSTNVHGTKDIDSSISDFGTTSAGIGSTSLGFIKGGLRNSGSAAEISTDHTNIVEGNKLTNSNKVNDVVNGLQANAGVPSLAIAQVTASASATVGGTSTTFGSNDDAQDKLRQVFNDKQKTTSGCAGGCGGGAYGGRTNFGIGNSLATPGYYGGWNSGLTGASASAQSIAGALSGARAFSVGGSYAGSSASAKVLSGYPTKGGETY